MAGCWIRPRWCGRPGSADDPASGPASRRHVAAGRRHAHGGRAGQCHGAAGRRDGAVIEVPTAGLLADPSLELVTASRVPMAPQPALERLPAEVVETARW